MMIRLFFSILLMLPMTAIIAKKKINIPERHVPVKGEENSLATLLNTLDPLSISQHLAFYHLYQEAPEGKEALAKAWALLGGNLSPSQNQIIDFPQIDLETMISYVTRPSFDTPPTLAPEHFTLINTLAQGLHNRGLKGYQLTSKAQALTLSHEETDLARSLLLFQIGDDEQSLLKIKEYEARLDLMALQIRSHLKPNATPQEIIKEMNHFIFYEMQFRFPPQSLHAADIDLYTFLPSVLDGRQGVCLGVSILYLSLAQRLNLPLEIITPPGHIYVRYHHGDTLINVETTARGINTPSETYLGINTRLLKQRPLKEVIGLAFMNQAAVYWTHEKYAQSLECYETAILFMPNDPLLKMFFGFSCLFNNKIGKGTALLREVKAAPFEEAISKETIPEDYLAGKVDIEGIKAVFLSVDETRESILKKQQIIEGIVQRYPRYRAGLFHLATTWLQLGRTKEAMPLLRRYHEIDPNNAVVEYYLSILCLERLDYNQAWSHLKRLTSLLEAKEHTPPALLSLRQHLAMLCPEPHQK